jgi:hypothetical protein
MLRGLLDAGWLFLLPFAVYALALVLGRRFTPLRRLWRDGPIARLILTGLALAIGFILLNGILAQRHLGAYVPAHLENGRLIQGHIE